MDQNRILNPMGQAIKPVSAGDQVPFTCNRCGNCCREVEDRIMLEPLDAWGLARHLRSVDDGIENVEDIYSRYAHPVMLEDIYPVFLLNTVGSGHSCVFLKDSRCIVYEARPRVCRLYPFSADSGCQFTYYQCLDCHAAHFKGRPVNVGDWMRDSFTREARAFQRAEHTTLAELGQLLRELGAEGRRRTLFQLLYYRYYNYTLDRPFMPQYRENQRQLMEALRRELCKEA